MRDDTQKGCVEDCSISCLFNCDDLCIYLFIPQFKYMTVIYCPPFKVLFVAVVVVVAYRFFLPLIKPGSNKIIQTTTNKQRILPKDHLLASLLPNCIHVRKSATRLPFNILTVYPLFFQSCVYNTCELLLATLITITMKMNSLANLRKFCNFCLFVWASVFCDSSDSSVFG